MDRTSADALVAMIDHAYASVTNDARWDDFLKLVSGHFREGSVLLWHTDHKDDRLNLVSSFGYDAKTLREVDDHYHAINPWLPKKMRMPGGSLHRTDELFPEDELVRTEFYAGLLAPNNLFNGFGLSLFNDRRFGFLSIVRSRRAGPPSPNELALLERLMPHLQRSLQLHERFQVPSQLAGPALSVLDSLSRGVIFVGRDRRVVHANLAAGRMLSSADGLFLDQLGVCRTSRVAEQVSLDLRLKGAINGRRHDHGTEAAFSSGGVMAVSRPSGSRAYSLVVAPAPLPPFGLTAIHIAAVITISDPDTKSGAARDLLRSIYCLSEKEARLAVQIAEGQQLSVAARDVGVTYETARSYLKEVFAKLGVSRQAELASVVQKLGGCH
jgi:DNA-binding CsgD family transcriptional regulator